MSHSPGLKWTLKILFLLLPLLLLSNISSYALRSTMPNLEDTASDTIEFRSYDCIIPIGKSTCAATVFVKGPNSTYGLKNMTRNSIIANLSNVNTNQNYTTTAGTNSFSYNFWVTTLENGVNLASFGVNDFALFEGSSIAVAKSTMNANCETGSTWNGKMCSAAWVIACTDSIRLCGDGSQMPRDIKSCNWLPNECPTEINPTNTFTPPKPYGNPTIQVLRIGGISINTNSPVEISKSPTAPLLIEWDITSSRSGLSLKVSSDTSDFFIMMPVSADWVWSTENSPSENIYKSRIVTEWDNLLIFSLLDDASKKPLAQTFVKVKVNFVKKGGINFPPTCMMVEQTPGTKPAICAPIEPQPAGTGGAKLPPRYLGPPDREGTWKVIQPMPYTPPPGSIGSTNTGGVSRKVDTPMPSCPDGTRWMTNNGTNASLCSSPIRVVVRDTIDEINATPSLASLDSTSKDRIDTIMARTETKVKQMSVADAISFIDAAVSRITSIPNKTSKAKLIDAYTIRKLTALKNSIINLSSGNGTESDYIGLVGGILESSSTAQK